MKSILNRTLFIAFLVLTYPVATNNLPVIVKHYAEIYKQFCLYFSETLLIFFYLSA